MTYRGHVKAGIVVLDDPEALPDGAEVNVELIGPKPSQGNLADDLRSLAGTVEGPVDWAQNHDHYIHGTPKRK